MSNNERKEFIERLAEKFVTLSVPEQSFIAGYMARVEEEHGTKKTILNISTETVKQN